MMRPPAVKCAGMALVHQEHALQAGTQAAQGDRGGYAVGALVLIAACFSYCFDWCCC